jgi:transcription antitermination factor NusA-like protein
LRTGGTSQTGSIVGQQATERALSRSVRYDSPERLITHALQPEVIEKVILHPAQHLAAVVVKADQASLVLGRRAENRELTSLLSGWQIQVEET